MYDRLSSTTAGIIAVCMKQNGNHLFCYGDIRTLSPEIVWPPDMLNKYCITGGLKEFLTVPVKVEENEEDQH